VSDGGRGRRRFSPLAIRRADISNRVIIWNNHGGRRPSAGRFCVTRRCRGQIEIRLVDYVSAGLEHQPRDSKTACSGYLFKLISRAQLARESVEAVEETPRKRGGRYSGMKTRRDAY